jgi:hypothetical protein
LSVETFNNEPASAIRIGDKVQDRHGRSFTALSDGTYNEVTGDYDVLSSDGKRWIAYGINETVTLSYDTSDYAEDIYA